MILYGYHNNIRGDNMANIMTIRPPDDLRQQLKMIAKARGFPLNSLVLQILWEWLEANIQEEKENPA